MSDMVSKATRNERRKIVAALFNGLAGAVIIVGFYNRSST